jgi:hypothetical protein
MYVQSPETKDLTVSLTSSDGLQNLASATITLVFFFSTMFRKENISLFTTAERIALLQSFWHIKLDKSGAEAGC